jgi:hypothetical protein
MYCLSIRQPWVWLILYGGKDIENRDWNTHVRGPILLHASQRMSRYEYDDAWGYYEMLRDEGLAKGPAMPGYHELPRGGIVGGPFSTA